MIELRPWTDPERPADAGDAPHVRGCWEMARLAHRQNAAAVRTLWDGEQLLALGGVVEIVKGDGLAFFWKREAAPARVWRFVIGPLQAGMQMAHERGVRTIGAIVRATWAEALRFIRRLGFVFTGLATGFGGETVPMLRYVHQVPKFDEPPVVAIALYELERACHAAWCPELLR